LDNKTAKYDLTFAIDDSPSAFIVDIEYNTDLFDHSTIEALADHFHYLLEQLSEHPEAPIDSISLLTHEQLLHVLSIDNDTYQAIYPLTETQKGIYLQNLVNPDSLYNCISYLFEANGVFDPQLWQQATELVYQSEPILRTQLKACSNTLADMAYQCVRSSVKPVVEVIDLSDAFIAGEDVEQQVTAIIKEKTYRPYQLTVDELSLNYIFVISPQRHYVATVFHHILLDGVGAFNLWKCIAAAYHALRDQLTYQHPEPQFHHHIVENRQKINSQSIQQFWKVAEKGVEPLHFLMPTRENKTAKIIEKTLSLEGNKWKQLRHFCRQQQMTPPLYFKAIYGLLLHYYCQPDHPFMIGDYLSGRKKQHMNAIGLYFEQAPFVFSIETMTAQVKDYFDAIKTFHKRSSRQLPLSLAKQQTLFPSGLLHATYNFYAWSYAEEFIERKQIGLTFAPQVADQQLQFIVKAMDNDVLLSLSYHDTIFAEIDFLEQIMRISDK
jgi:hypothetical protein